MKQTLIIDGDMLAFRACAATEVETEWEDGLWTVHGHVEDAAKYMQDKIAQCRRKVDEKNEDSVDVVIMFSCSGKTFRHQLNPEYKANRKARKPVHYKGAVAWCWDNYECRMVDNLEADDLIGIAVTNPKMFRGRKIVVTGDKDLGTIPGEHINLMQIEKGVYEVDELEARRFFYMQALMGDTVDGYHGCPGVGKVSAQRTLAGLKTDEDMWVAVLDTFSAAYRDAKIKYEKTEDLSVFDKFHGDCYESALLNCRMARILDNTGFNLKTKEVNLWQPPTDK